MKYIIYDTGFSNFDPGLKIGIAIAKASAFGDIFEFYQSTSKNQFFYEFSSNPKTDFIRLYFYQVHFHDLTQNLKDDCNVELKNNQEIYTLKDNQDLFHDVFFEHNHTYYRHVWFTDA